MVQGRRNALILGGVALGAAAIGGLVGALALQSGSGAASLLAARFTDLSGEPRRLVDWQGKALCCNFWATWCTPCREEIPLLNAAQQRHAADGLQVIGIAIDNGANVVEFAKSTRVGYPVLLGSAGAIALMRELGNPKGGLPFTVLLDVHGRLTERKLGAFSGPELAAAVARLLQ